MGLFGNNKAKERVELLDDLDLTVAEKIMIEQNETIIRLLSVTLAGNGSLVGGSIAASINDQHKRKLSKWIKE